MKRDNFTKSRKEFLAKSVEELLELLTSENLQTRFFAEMALRDLSGT
jgi:hypothetical protein